MRPHASDEGREKEPARRAWEVGHRSLGLALRLPDGDLLVHSPVGLDPPLAEAMDKLGGEVKHVISPNYEHVKYARSWSEAFEGAHMWGCPGLMEREPDRVWRSSWGVEWRMGCRWDGAGW